MSNDNWTHLDYFLRLVPQELIEIAKIETIKRIQKKVPEFRQYWRDDEFEMFISGILMMLIYPTANIREYFYDKAVKYPFLTEMFMYKDFALYLSCLAYYKNDWDPAIEDICNEQSSEESEDSESLSESSDDLSSSEEDDGIEIDYDKLTPQQKLTYNIGINFVKKLAESFKKNMPFTWILSMDEALLKCQSRTKNLQYMPLKPGKWGFLFRCICDAVTGYCVNLFMVQHGIKVSNVQVCQKLFKGFAKQVYSVAMDNFYTSKNVINFLNEMQYRFVGTIRLNRSGIKEFPQINPEGYLTIPKNDNDRQYNLTFYQVKKNKKVILASSYIPPNAKYSAKVGRQQEGKPEIAKNYCEWYGGVDLMDHYLSSIRPHMRTRRWPVKLFLHLLTITLHNAHKLWKIDHKDDTISLRDFTMQVAFQLKAKHMKFTYVTVNRCAKSHQWTWFKNVDELNEAKAKKCPKCKTVTRKACSCGLVLCQKCYQEHYEDIVLHFDV